MTFTVNFDWMAIAAWSMMALLLYTSGVGHFVIRFWVAKYGEDSPLLTQIQKLVMANNIDRAIKLCNSCGDRVSAACAKKLLVVANRETMLDTARDVAIANCRGEYGKLRSKDWKISVVRLLGGSLVTILAAFGHPTGLMWAAGLFVLMLNGYSYMKMYAATGGEEAAVAQLHELHSWLKRRQETRK